jgi:photosystem II stability/assembly factor-like uncharacterized protein
MSLSGAKSLQAGARSLVTLALAAIATLLALPAHSQGVVQILQGATGEHWNDMALYDKGHKLFVSDSSRGKILVIDTVSLARSELALPNVGIGMAEWMAVHEGTGTLYVGIPGNDDTTLVVDADSHAIGPALTGFGSRSATVDEKRGRLYALGSSLDQTLTAIDVTSNTVVGSVNVGSLMSMGILDLDRNGGLNPVTGEIVITNRHADEFAIINGPALTGEGIAAQGSRGWTGVWNPAENRVYITTITWGGYFTYDRDTSTAGFAGCATDGTNLFYSAAKNRVYSGAEINGSLVVMDGATGTCQVVAVGGGLPTLGFAATRSHAYVAGAHGVRVLDENTLGSLAWFPIPGPEGGGTVDSQVVVAASSQRVFVRAYRDLTSGAASAILVVDDLAPLINTQPQPQTIRQRDTAKLMVGATGTGSLHYQWYQGARGDLSTPVGSDSATLVTPALDASTAFWVRVSDAVGHTDSVDVMVTVDAGLGKWLLQTSHTENDLFDVYFVDQNTGWAVGYLGTILHTTDGGETWARQTSGTSYELSAVHFADANHGWIVGWSGNVWRTSDGGITWTRRASGTTYDLKDVFFLDGNRGWAVGAYGALVPTTTDGGVTWVPGGQAISNWLYGVRFLDPSTGWAVGSDGYVIRTGNGGATWTVEDTGSIRSLYGLDFFGRTGWAVGQGCIFSRSESDGAWVRRDEGRVSATLNDVDFVTAERGWAVGTGGTIVRSIDGGVSWFGEPSGTARDLQGVHFVDTKTGWAVGLAGTILKYVAPPFALTVTRTGEGSGTVTSQPAGIDCGTDCGESYAFGSQVTLLATPNTGSSLAGWTGACTGTGTCSVSMDLPRAVTVRFDPGGTGGQSGTGTGGTSGGTGTGGTSSGGTSTGGQPDGGQPTGGRASGGTIPAAGGTIPATGGTISLTGGTNSATGGSLTGGTGGSSGTGGTTSVAGTGGAGGNSGDGGGPGGAAGGKTSTPSSAGGSAGAGSARGGLGGGAGEVTSGSSVAGATAASSGGRGSGGVGSGVSHGGAAGSASSHGGSSPTSPGGGCSCAIDHSGGCTMLGAWPAALLTLLMWTRRRRRGRGRSPS